MLKKNDLIEFEIGGMTNEGSGVGRHEGMAVFVPDTAVGDRITCRIVKVNKSYCYGIVERLNEPSRFRCGSGCAVYGKCGGCCMRHMTYERELEEKQGFVADAFRRIGRLEPVFEPIIGSAHTDRYRNKAQFPVSADENGRLFAGFYARRSHRVIRADDCPLLPEVFLQISADILDFCNEKGVTAYDEFSGEGLLRHIFLRRGYHSGEIMAALVVTSFECEELFSQLAVRLSERFSDIRSVMLNLNPDRTNVILGESSKLLYGREFISDIMCGNRIEISLNSFYQINTAQAERVYELAAEFAQLTPDNTLLDLYCGAGTVGLSMARNVRKLIGVEIVPAAIDNARANASLNGIGNAEFICSDAGKAAQMLCARGERPDVIIADPARKGCTHDTLAAMADMQPKRIVMISCNPSTAARDCAELERLGYRAEICRAVDFFPRTQHVECVVLLTKR